MKRVTAFDTTRELIVVDGEIAGPRGCLPLRLALDTAATETLVTPDIVDGLGYSPRNADAITGVYSAIGKEQGYVLRVDRFTALGFSIDDFRIHVFDLVDHYPIDGLIGLSFLRRFNYEIRSEEGLVLVEEIASRR